MPKLRNSYPGAQLQKGTGQNVLKFAYEGKKVDIVLLPKKEFDAKVEKYKKMVI